MGRTLDRLKGWAEDVRRRWQIKRPPGWSAIAPNVSVTPPPTSGCSNGITDGATYAPPSSGTYAYNNWNPSVAGFPALNQSFNDPVFGSRITRFTNEYPTFAAQDIYAKSGFWNADGTRLWHKSYLPQGFPNTSARILNSQSGAVEREFVPGNFDMSFDPGQANIYYYFGPGTPILRQYDISTGSDTVRKTFGENLGSLGGSVDWLDRTGRYAVLHLGSAFRVWDSQTDTLYTGLIPDGVGGGWAGISPDGNYVITAGTGKRSYAINHGTQSVNTTGVLFWDLCGDHGDVISASDGKTYCVTFECHSDPGIWAVDVTLPVGTPAETRAHSTKLFALDWPDNDGHISGISSGALQNWALVSVESPEDVVGNPGTWRPYKQEIVMANVLTGEVKRLAHHRSRGTGAHYYHQPRICVAWNGSIATWASNFGEGTAGVSDLYTLTPC